MKNKYVILTLDGEKHIFPSIAQMYNLLGHRLDVTLHSIYNAISKHGGIYSRNNFKIEYKQKQDVKIK